MMACFFMTFRAVQQQQQKQSRKNNQILYEK